MKCNHCLDLRNCVQTLYNHSVYQPGDGTSFRCCHVPFSVRLQIQALMHALFLHMDAFFLLVRLQILTLRLYVWFLTVYHTLFSHSLYLLALILFVLHCYPFALLGSNGPPLTKCVSTNAFNINRHRALGKGIVHKYARRKLINTNRTLQLRAQNNIQTATYQL